MFISVLLPAIMLGGWAGADQTIRNARSAIPQEIYRDDVEPAKGGKVPEAAHMRIELNKIDAAGLDNADAIRMEQLMSAESPSLPDHAPPEMLRQTSGGRQETFSDFSQDFPFNPTFDSNRLSSLPDQSYPTNPYQVMYNSLFDDTSHKLSDPSSGFSPPLKLKPNYAPEPYSPPKPAYVHEPAYVPEPVYIPKASYVPDPYVPEPAYVPAYVPEPAYNPPRPSYTPEPAYSPPTPAYSPEPYTPPKPAYVPPTGPVLLEKRPYEVKSVQPLPISVSETYTNFDCRTKPYPGRHYADPEANCEIYHFCHEDGKQDVFHCSYGTIFNEYLGTCDYKNNVHCGTGEGYAPKPAPYHKPAPAPYQEPAPYKDPAPYHPPESYHQPAPYHEPAPYNPPAQYHKPAHVSYHKPEPSYHEPFQAFGPFGYEK